MKEAGERGGFLGYNKFMKIALLLGLVALAAPSMAANSVRLNGKPQDEAALLRFLSENPRVKARLDAAIRQEAALKPLAEETDLRDAVADRTGALDHGAGRGVPAPSSCRTLSDCAAPELATEAATAAELPQSIARIVRPWVLLQQARGGSLAVAPAAAPGDAALVLTPRGLRTAPLTVHVTARPLGGFDVWLERPFELAAVYGDARGAALEPRR